MKNIFRNDEISKGFDQLEKVIKNKDCLNLDTTFNYKELTYKLLEHDIICPHEEHWADLWKVLQNGHIRNKKIPEPLICDAWHYSSEEEKRDRFFELLKTADEHEKLDIAIRYLNKLQIDKFNLEFVIIL